MRMHRLLAVTLVMGFLQGAETARVSAAESPGIQKEQATASPEGSYRVAQACGWWAIFGCAKNYGAAQGYVNRWGGGCVVDTDSCNNFAGGFYCAASGPKTQQAAEITASRIRQAGMQSYTKWSCCPSSC
jgi:hypothetical protein